MNQRRGGRSARPSRELWLNAVKDGGGNNPPGGKRKGNDMGGVVRTAWENNRPGLYGGSTPDSLNLVGVGERKSTGGLRKPTYKTPEEYYDDIIELKKQIGTVQGENELLKSKFRRIGEESAKKDKQMEQLLNPVKDGELRRTLGDKKGDSSVVVHSLKQKIFRLETQLRERESDNSKLQADIKLTKVDEYRIQAEVHHAEILRLRELLSNHPPETPNGGLGRGAVTPPVSARGSKPPPSGAAGGASVAKLDAVQKKLKLVTDENTRLLSDNRCLKQDLDRLLAEKATQAVTTADVNGRGQGGRGRTRSSSSIEARKEGRVDLEDMNREQLIKLILDYEEKLSNTDTLDAIKCKTEVVTLRLDLENHKKRQSLRSIEIENYKALAVKNRELGENEYKEKYESKCHEVDELEATIIKLKQDVEKQGISLANGSPYPQPKPALRKRGQQGGSSGPSNEEIDEFKNNHAAKVIQKEWRSHQEDENISLIQSAIRGHKSREDHLQVLQAS